MSPTARRTLYCVWKTMHYRCESTKHPSYRRYGGRGIKVCKRWDKFENFITDMGERPKGMSLDRRDNEKGYSKSNCRWATRGEQTLNRRGLTLLTYNGVTRPLAQMARLVGISKATLTNRVKNLRWTVEEAIETPIRAPKKGGRLCLPR